MPVFTAFSGSEGSVTLLLSLERRFRA